MLLIHNRILSEYTQQIKLFSAKCDNIWLNFLLDDLLAIVGGSPNTTTRYLHYINLYLMLFSIFRAIVASIALMNQTLWSMYIKIDKLAFTGVENGQLDLVFLLNVIVYLSKVCFFWYKYYFCFNAKNSYPWLIPLDILGNVYKHRQRSLFFPDVIVSRYRIRFWRAIKIGQITYVGGSFITGMFKSFYFTLSR